MGSAKMQCSVVAAIAMAIASYLALSTAPGISRAQIKSSADTGYVDPAACARCHREIWETYRRTGMGRSFYRPTPSNTVENYTEKNTYYHKPSDSYFTMLQR